MRIKAVVLDVDGVLTDGTFWWGGSGEEFKRFSFADIMGISMGRKAGLIFALISGENSPLVDRFAKKMGVSDIYKDCKDKGAALQSFAQKHNLDLSQVCFMGDDVNDLSAMKLAGLAAAPVNAHHTVRQEADLVMQKCGGQGAVRELVDILLSRMKQQTSSKKEN
ncbi:MAG: HAD family hydrolase [Thermodesulfovibrionales bacterium]|jgi:3-deoxy-D-manno-octulosonate 8-phosphate phosphatase (KDO 8-P phosphatase)